MAHKKVRHLLFSKLLQKITASTDAVFVCLTAIINKTDDCKTDIVLIK